MKILFAGAFILLSFLISDHEALAKTDLETIRAKVVKELMQSEVDDVEIETLIQSINEDGTWSDINYKDVSRTGFEHRKHLSNQVKLARAYKKKSSRFYRKKKIKKTVELALEHWVDNDYICDNWWHNQIGTPNALVSLILIIGDDLPDDLVKKVQTILARSQIEAPGARPGGDRIKIAGIQAKNLLFNNDEALFDKVIQVIESEIKFVSSLGIQYGYGNRPIQSGFSTRNENGRGMQYDYSFHHRTDGVNNTISYGLGYADAFVEWATYTAGSKYAFSNEKLEHLVDYFLDGICKTAVYGKYPDAGAKNRSISRKGTLKAYSAQTAERLLLTTAYRKEEIQEIVDIRNKDVKPTLSHATFFWQSEHFTFQRPDFFASVRMYSSRVHNMEQPYNSEGLLNHHRGDGTNHISRSGEEYYDIAPVFDYQKIPGATILQKPELPSEKEIQKLGKTDFAGAVTDGKYGAVGFDFNSPHDLLCARKAWFFFDQEYVCLGAGISTKSELSVATTLNQCLLKDDVTISANRVKSVLSKGEKTFEEVDWVFQDGIGYIFPQPTLVNIKNDKARGSWWKINKQADSSKDEMSLDVFKLWLDHGARPDDASYAYIVAPATTITQLEKGASRQNISIISNTPELQAVKHEGLDMYQLVFYKSGEIQLSSGVKLVSDSPGIVLLKMDGLTISEISVSDPNRELRKMNLSISLKVEKEGERYQALWNEKREVSDISIDLPQGDYAGKSVTVKL